MTFKTTVKTAAGAPASCWVAATIQETGQIFARNTDGNGYADLACPNVPVGSHVTFLSNLQIVSPTYGTITQSDQTISMVVEPSFKLPTRAQACSLRRHFQGLTVNTSRGPLPWFVAGLTSAAFDNERPAILAQLSAAGDTHAQVDVTWSYDEPGQPWAGLGRDLTNDLSTYVSIVRQVIASGMIPVYAITGEGSPAWIQTNLWRLVAALGPQLLQAGPFYVVYDGVWPATWTVANMKQMIPFMRNVIGNDGYLGFMFANGPNGSPYVYVESEGDYGQPWMQALDFVMISTGPDQVQCPALVNYMQYLLGPNLKPQGACTPGWRGPWLMAPGTPRGPYFAGVDEFLEYQFVRGQVTGAQIAVIQGQMDALGITNHG